jgi:hypothetical protein
MYLKDMAVQTSIEADKLERQLIFSNENEKPTRDTDSNKKKKKHSKHTSKSPIIKKNNQQETHGNSNVVISDEKNDLTKVSSIFDSYNNDNNTKNQVVIVSSSAKSSINNFTTANQANELQPYIEETINYESDEILNMLFKKLFFYQSKLK